MPQSAEKRRAVRADLKRAAEGNPDGPEARSRKLALSKHAERMVSARRSRMQTAEVAEGPERAALAREAKKKRIQRSDALEHAKRLKSASDAGDSCAIAALAQIEKKKAEAAVRRQASRLEKRVRITTLMVYVALERVKAGFLESLALSREAAPDLGVFRASQAVLQEPFLTAATPPDVLWREITRNVGRSPNKAEWHRQAWAFLLQTLLDAHGHAAQDVWLRALRDVLQSRIWRGELIVPRTKARQKWPCLDDAHETVPAHLAVLALPTPMQGSASANAAKLKELQFDPVSFDRINMPPAADGLAPQSPQQPPLEVLQVMQAPPPPPQTPAAAPRNIPPPPPEPAADGNGAASAPPAPEAVGDAAATAPPALEPAGDAAATAQPPPVAAGDTAATAPPPLETAGDAAATAPPPPEAAGDAAATAPPPLEAAGDVATAPPLPEASDAAAPQAAPAPNPTVLRPPEPAPQPEIS
ncbi:hypothetical protein M885DRAFT_540203 [Pelagophyceae sp. CCMP2097]|nr:hypothetical protein M885DRAFT_540203 [Pelagophyceae sp. CCMP2097]